ncbi:MAG: HEAT repeat domain-containing protein [Candidatus Omnitrophica bacterium]|nr:HEAT repeat domain-containing protein [Candidatus Omnitrophota bacterium]
MAIVIALALAVPARAEQASGLSEKAADALRLVESGDDYQRQMGFLRLEALREPAVVAALMAYTTQKNEELRAGSVRAIAAIQGEASVPFLLETLRHDRHPRVRRAAILGMEPFVAAHPETVPVVIAALRDRETTVRMTAVDVVSRIKDPRAREAIRTRYKREGRRDVRRVLKLAMERLGE